MFQFYNFPGCPERSVNFAMILKIYSIIMYAFLLEWRLPFLVTSDSIWLYLLWRTWHLIWVRHMFLLLACNHHFKCHQINKNIADILYLFVLKRTSYSSNIFHISGCKLWLSFKGLGKSLCKTIIRRTIGFLKKRNTIIAAIFCFRIITKTTRQKTAGIGVWEINLIFSFEKNILITYSIEVI